ncbi:MAG: hypothetical protein R3F54_21930 [Alphaproteobacteria bacterium]
MILGDGQLVENVKVNLTFTDKCLSSSINVILDADGRIIDDQPHRQRRSTQRRTMKKTGEGS